MSMPELIAVALAACIGSIIGHALARRFWPGSDALAVDLLEEHNDALIEQVGVLEAQLKERRK